MHAENTGALEALLFASDAPLERDRLAEVLDIGLDQVEAEVETLRKACEARGRGVALVEVAGGLRLVTRPEFAAVLLRLQRLRLRSRLSRAALETLAIVGYRQPISRPEIEQLRGVGAESVLTHLLERRLVRVVGRRAGPGRPILYGTTREFLEHFGLRDLEDLPPFEVPGAGLPSGDVETAPPPEGAPVPAAPGPEARTSEAGPPREGDKPAGEA